MANDLRLQVVLDLVNSASGPLRNITKSSTEAAKTLKATRDTLQRLNQQQRAVDGFNRQQAATRESSNKVRMLQQNLQVLNLTQGSSRKEIANAEKALAKATVAYGKNKDAVFALRQQLTTLGIGKVSEAEKRLKTDIAATTQAYNDQTASLRALNEQRGKLHALNKRHSKEMVEVGMLAGVGMGAQAAGRGMARPVLSSVQAYAQQESASAGLMSSMMLADGSVSAEFKQINELATRLGDKLPGTTADFIEMMRTLKEQGISAKSILGGTGEAAAFLGVRLKLPAAEAAKFAAQMQDATKTPERDMMSLMDTIQRVNSTGVESGYMLQGFSKMSSVLGIIKQEGVQAANTLAPLLAMANQSGMNDGGSAGNAIRKVIDGTLDAKKLGKANAALASAGTGFKLKFTDTQGNFSGLENIFAQLQKIKGINSDTTRKSVLKEMFGDDAETQQILEIMMTKGMAVYKETIAKLQEQADLRKKVDAELGTISNLWEATTGTFTNVMAAMGQTIAPEIKALTNWLGDVAGGVRAWIAEHPVLVGWLVKIVAVVAGLTFGLGTLSLVLASVLGPFFLMRFALSWLGLKFNFWAAAIRVVGVALTWLRGVMLLLMAGNPVALAITAIVVAIAGTAALVYKYWGPIQAFFAGVWAGLSDAIAPTITSISTALLPLRPVWDWLTGGLASAWNWFTQLLAPMQATTGQLLGISNAGHFVGQVLGNLVSLFIRIPQALIALPSMFVTIGGMLMDGLVGGITNRLAAVKAAIVGVADSTVGWFREKLGIRSPSRVFLAAGVNVGEGAAIGITSTTDLVRKAGAGIAAAATIALPAIAPPALAGVPESVQAAISILPKMAMPTMPPLTMPPLPGVAAAAGSTASEPLRIDTRAPMATAGTAQRQAAVIQGDTITIQINAAPGMEPQAIARAVSAELDKRDRAKAARRRSALGDIN